MVHKRESISPLSEIRERKPSIIISIAKRVGELSMQQFSKVNNVLNDVGAGLGIIEPIPKENRDK